jgi:hypothetical protein
MLKISLNNPESGWAYARLSDQSKESLVIGAPRKNKVKLTIDPQRVRLCFREPQSLQSMVLEIKPVDFLGVLVEHEQ